jgi:hypothetical protein
VERHLIAIPRGRPVVRRHLVAISPIRPDREPTLVLDPGLPVVPERPARSVYAVLASLTALALLCCGAAVSIFSLVGGNGPHLR